MHACLLHCMRVRLRNGYMQAYTQIMQHTHMHKAVTGRVEARAANICISKSGRNYASVMSEANGASRVAAGGPGARIRAPGGV